MARTTQDPSVIKRGESLAKTIQSERVKLGLTQEELAIKSGIRIDTLRSIESGRICAPNVFIVADLAKTLKGDLNKWLKH